jgi:hypothetical protein
MFKKDILGKKFGRLTVVKEAGSDSQGRILWLCRCQCGAHKVVCGYHLRSGEIKSCGCWRREFLIKHGDASCEYQVEE